jgi:molybdate transport system ATP-binding protein
VSVAEPAGAGLDVALEQTGPIPLAVDLRCPPGELLALVGPSGSGKTTVLRTIAGLYRPQRGHVRCGGRSWLDTGRGIDLPPQHRAVGLVFQDYALFPHLSVTGNVAAALGHLPREQRRERITRLLEQVNLDGLQARRPQTLSGGQQQRVAIARALARDPAVLLLDEPFSAVDQVTRHKLRRELAQLRASLQIPVVLVTHDLDEAAMLCDQMCILHRGESLQHGPPLEVMRRPHDVQVARLVDMPNVFDGEVCEQRSEPALTCVRWLGMVLEARAQPGFAPGQRVAWAIPSAAIILHRRDRPSRGERENPVDGFIERMVPMGESASVTLRIGGDAGPRLSLSVPMHVAERNRLAQGGAARVSLRADAIQIMPWEAAQGPD